MADMENKGTTQERTFSVIKPGFFDEFLAEQKDGNDVRYTVTETTVAVEYSFPLDQEAVVRKLMSIKEIMNFISQPIKPEFVEKYTDKADDMVEEFPTLKYYGLARGALMHCIQARNFSIEKRFVLMNFVFSTMDKLIKENREADIVRFIGDFLRDPKKEKIMEIYSPVQPNLELSIIDALYLLHALPATPELAEIRKTVFERLGYKEDLSNVKQNVIDKEFTDKYMLMKKNLMHDYLGQGTKNDKQYMLENVIIGFIWTYGVPTSDARYSIWHNFVFFNQIMNCLKVLLTVYLTDKNRDDDFVKVVTAFDATLRRSKGVDSSLVQAIVEPTKKRGFDTNGDMAVMSIS